MEKTLEFPDLLRLIDERSTAFRASNAFRAEHVVRPGLDRLTRAVAGARVTAGEEVRRRLAPILTPERCTQLDALVTTDPELGVAPLVWLGYGATTASRSRSRPRWLSWTTCATSAPTAST